MNYIIFDMEWNQPFSKETAIVSPIYLAGEIIQIGAIKLNINLRAVDCLNLLIAPTFYRKLHYRIKKMTGIHQNDLAKQKNSKRPSGYSAIGADPIACFYPGGTMIFRS